MDGTVKFSGSVAGLADEPRHAERPWLSIAPRDHQPRRLAVSPRRCERARCRRSPGPTRPHGVLRRDPAVVPHGWFSRRAPAHASKQGRLGDIGPLDEGFVTLQGQRRSLWRAVDQAGDVLDSLVQARRDCRAATGLRPERSCRPSPSARTDTSTIVPTSPTSPHGTARDTCAGSTLPGRHNDSCPCMDSSAPASAVAVTWCERCIIGNDEDALFSLGMPSRPPPDSN